MYKRLNECIANNKGYFYKLLWCITLHFIIAAITFNFSSCKQLFEGENDKESASIVLQLPSTKRSLGDTAQNYAEITKHYEVSFIRSGISDITVKGLPGETVTSGEILEGSYDVEVYAYSYEDKKIGYGKKTDVRVIDGETTLITIGISEIKEPTNDDEDQDPLENPIGSKLKPTAVGDIVFSDGTASAYTEDLSEMQIAKAVAVIFYDGVSSNKLGSKVLGVGTTQGISKAWQNSATQNHGYIFTSNYEPEDPSANLQTWDTDITETSPTLSSSFNSTSYTSKSLLAELKAETDGQTYSEENYPAWYWVENYNAEKPASAKSDWYMPCDVELCRLYLEKTKVNQALNKIGATQLNSTYWSANIGVRTTANFGPIVNFSTGKFSFTSGSSENDVCVVIEF